MSSGPSEPDITARTPEQPPDYRERVHHFTVGIRGQDVDVNRLVGDLGAAGIRVGRVAEEPPEAEHVLIARLDAENAQQAKAHVIEHLPPVGDYTVDEPVQID